MGIVVSTNDGEHVSINWFRNATGKFHQSVEMNRIIRPVVIFGCVVIPMATLFAKVSILEVPPPPKLVNPSFEDPGDATDRAAGWGRWGDWFNREEGWTPVHSGHCILGYHHWQIQTPNASAVYQDVTGAVKGTPYTFGVYLSVDKAKEPTKDAQTVEMRLESTVDGRQTVVASALYQVANLPADAWQKLMVSGTPTNDTLRVLIIVTPSPVNGTRGGALRFDDAFLDLAPATPSPLPSPSATQ
jgi:hypothetical protein